MCLERRAAALLVALASAAPATAGADAPHAVGPVVAPPLVFSFHSPTAGSLRAQHDGVRVTIMLVADNPARLSNAAVVLAPEDEAATGQADAATRDLEIRPDGSFVFSNVAPGAYRIHARAGVDAGKVSLVALHRIVVQREDVRVTLTLRPTATVSGRLVAESADRSLDIAAAALRVRAAAADGSAFGDAVAADVLRDGSFVIHGVAAGRHVLRVEGLIDPWVLARVTSRGQDVTDTGIEFATARSIADVRIAITTAATEVSGTVRDSDGRAVSGATVLLIPSAPEFWTRVSRRLGRTVTDGEGRYRYRGLPAGEYRVAAAMLADDDAYRHEQLRELSAHGARLTLAAAANEVIDLPLTAAIAAPRTAARR